MKRFDFVGEVIRPITPQACSSEVSKGFSQFQIHFWQMNMGDTHSADDKIKDPNYFVYISVFTEYVS